MMHESIIHRTTEPKSQGTPDRAWRPTRAFQMVLFLSPLLLVLCVQMTAAQGNRPDPDATPAELIILLSAEREAPTPEAAVAAINRGQGLDPAFYVGNPRSARLALNHRAQGAAARERLLANPDSPRARLERYVVMTYSENANLDAIMKALERAPNVLHVEKNLTLSFSAVTPNDSFFPDQWALPTLGLPEAWEKAKGHASVGLIDLGIQTDHPDLRAFPAVLEKSIIGDNGQQKTICVYSQGNYEGGNFRPHLSRDTYKNDCDVDDSPGNYRGHGTHVAGIVGATSNSNEGVTGACWHCNLMITKVDGGSLYTWYDVSADALTFLADHGAQVVSMSWGGDSLNCTASSLDMLCVALALAEERDIVLSASAGNDKEDIEFPASDNRVLAIGGLEPDGDFWDRADEGGSCPDSDTFECGSNYTLTPGTASQDLVAPAEAVLSTMYEGFDHNPRFGCGDSTFPALGYGLCTGTSMSSPYVAGIAGLLRSTNPLLDKDEIRDALIKNASLGHLQSPHAKLGFGIPNAATALDAVLGQVAGETLPNRLTPLFNLRSTEANTHLSTTSPQRAAAALHDTEVKFWATSVIGQGPVIQRVYERFPGVPCPVGPCDNLPQASAYIFTTDKEPFAGAPPLVPLYRMSSDEPWNGNLKNRSFFYTTEETGIEAFRPAGYELDGREGYIFQRCAPEPACIPKGAARLFRLYHPGDDDYAIFPESKEQLFRDAGYISQPSLNDWIGYVYPNVDTDRDFLIDGFESLAGTNPLEFDTDCDGLLDKDEIFVYSSDGYGDPLDGPCTAMNIHISDDFTGSNGSPLHGRQTQVGGATWSTTTAAILSSNRVIDSTAIGGLPFDLPSLPSGTTVELSVDVDPWQTGWVAVGFASAATQAYWAAGRLWVHLTPNNRYHVHADGQSVANGQAPGTPRDGIFHNVAIRYTTGSRFAEVLINGIQVATRTLATDLESQYVGFHMFSPMDWGDKIDNVQVKRLSAPAATLISDSFSGSGLLNGRSAEVGGVTWAAMPSATLTGLAGGVVIDRAAIGGVPFNPDDLDGNPIVSMEADIDAFQASWVGTGFAREAANFYWASGQLWVLVRPTGEYEAFALGTMVASGNIPGSAVNGFHHIEITYNTRTRQTRMLINDHAIFDQVISGAPDIQYVGFHMHRTSQGGGKIDNVRVLSTAAP